MLQKIGLHRQICQESRWSWRMLVGTVVFCLLIGTVATGTADPAVRQVEPGRLQQHVRTLAGVGSRVTGYPVTLDPTPASVRTCCCNRPGSTCRTAGSAVPVATVPIRRQKTTVPTSIRQLQRDS